MKIIFFFFPPRKTAFKENKSVGVCKNAFFDSRIQYYMSNVFRILHADDF